MPLDFHLLETGYVARRHGVLEKDIVLQMALTGSVHDAGAARWIINDPWAVDMDSARPRPFRSADGQPSRRRPSSAAIAWATLRPLTPQIPAPGYVPAPHRYKPSSGVR